MAPRHPFSAASGVYGNLMLAPMVIAMRLPLLASEAGSEGRDSAETLRAVSEKATAMMEGTIAAQTALVKAQMAFWPELMAGRMPSLLTGQAASEAMTAAFRPSGRRVKANFRRLSRRKISL